MTSWPGGWHDAFAVVDDLDIQGILKGPVIRCQKFRSGPKAQTEREVSPQEVFVPI